MNEGWHLSFFVDVIWQVFRSIVVSCQPSRKSSRVPSSLSDAAKHVYDIVSIKSIINYWFKAYIKAAAYDQTTRGGSHVSWPCLARNLT